MNSYTAQQKPNTNQFNKYKYFDKNKFKKELWIKLFTNIEKTFKIDEFNVIYYSTGYV